MQRTLLNPLDLGKGSEREEKGNEKKETREENERKGIMRRGNRTKRKLGKLTKWENQNS